MRPHFHSHTLFTSLLFLFLAFFFSFSSSLPSYTLCFISTTITQQAFIIATQQVVSSPPQLLHKLSFSTIQYIVFASIKCCLLSHCNNCVSPLSYPLPLYHYFPLRSLCHCEANCSTGFQVSNFPYIDIHKPL